MLGQLWSLPRPSRFARSRRSSPWMPDTATPTPSGSRRPRRRPTSSSTMSATPTPSRTLSGPTVGPTILFCAKSSGTPLSRCSAPSRTASRPPCAQRPTTASKRKRKKRLARMQSALKILIVRIAPFTTNTPAHAHSPL